MLKLRADDTLDYSSVLERAAASGSAVKHVNINVPQENVLVSSRIYGFGDERPQLKLRASSLQLFLESEAASGLQTFDLVVDECCERFTVDATDGGRALAALGRCRELQALRLSNPVFDSVAVFSTLLNPNLMELNLWRPRLEGTSSPQSMSPLTPWSRQTCKAFVRAIVPLKKLVKLSVADNYFQDDDLDELLSGRTNLRSLDLSGGFGCGRANNHLITDEGLRIIARNCPNLQRLELYHQKAITMAGLERILRACRHLRELAVGVSVDASLSRILPIADNLLRLGIDGSLPAPIIEDAVLATGGRVVVTSTCMGIIDLKSGSPECRRTWQRSKGLVENCKSKLDDPAVYNEWESLFEADIGDATAGSTTTPAPGATEPSSIAPLSCSWIGCPNRENENIDLLACSQCKNSWYCRRACQKAHWEVHKFKCVAPTIPRHVVEDFTISSVQAAIDGASPGDAVVLKEGTYESAESRTTLTINKPLFLIGPLRGMDSVKLECDIEIKASGSTSNSAAVVNLADFEVAGTGNLTGNTYKAVNLYNIRIRCPKEARDDAFSTGDLTGKCLFLDCEIYGGSDGVFIGGTGVHLKRTEIRFAQNRGIFSRRHFVIEDCTIDGCGGYGIKGTGGWREKGQNDIQPGPWSSHGGGGGGGFGF
mmetsp:Transcript_12680/g.30159  ORF Transcript_12680/g.30159 Transcript_12680/m.30159 type:complete len:654 (+) Transcript_12680:100-2061(+)